MGIKSIFKNVTEACDKNSPTILAGLAVGGLITTVIFAVRATPKINDILEEAKEEDKPKAEIAKEVLPVLAPTLVMGAATTACIIGGNRISNKRIAALSAAYSIAEASTKQWVEKTQEVVGDKKTTAIHDKVCEERVKANLNPEALDRGEYIPDTGYGNVICMDSFSGIIFRCSPERIKKIINEANAQMNAGSKEHTTLNELYKDMGVPTQLLPKFGDQFGFNRCDGLIDFWDSSCLTENSYPVYVIDWKGSPVPLWGRY